MKCRELGLPGLKLLTPHVFRDERGFLCETYNKSSLTTVGITADFVQDNLSLSLNRGVVRGMHFQCPPKAQAKLVRVNRGAILDVVVDIRTSSATFGRHITVELSSENWHQLWIPKGFAHGFCTLTANTEVTYKVTEVYSPKHERGLAWDDPELGIAWPVAPEKAILSEKDRGYPHIGELTSYFSS